MIKISFVVLATSLLLLPTASGAADSTAIPRKSAYTPLEAKVRDWSGAYFGIHGGLDANGYRSRSTSALAPLNFSGSQNTLNASGGDLGVQAGYNLQFGNLVTGVEAESSLLLTHRETSSTNLVARTNSLHVIKGKVGYSFGSTMLYGVSGFAIAPMRITSPANGGSPETSRSATYVGPMIGFGLEHMLTDRVSVKGEANYAMLGTHNLILPAGTTKVDAAHLSLKAGFNFRF